MGRLSGTCRRMFDGGEAPAAWRFVQLARVALSGPKSLSVGKTWSVEYGVKFHTTHKGERRTMPLSPIQISAIRQHWKKNPYFLGFPDAERDAANSSRWMEHLLVRPSWFTPAFKREATLIVGRKGVGKSAARIAAMEQYKQEGQTLVIEASADELAAQHSARLTEAAARGFGAVSDWCQIFAELIVRHVAQELTGTLVIRDDDVAVRNWAVMDGISERDFGERLASAMASLVPWARKLLDERQSKSGASEVLIRRVASAKAFALYIDDFDNLQESRSYANIRLIRDAVEAADRITHHSNNHNTSVHLLMRQDLWLRLRPGWHYADKVSGLVQLNWNQDDLIQWANRRLRLAAADALNITPSQLPTTSSQELWDLFFPSSVTLEDRTTSPAPHYLVRRTMYTPRSLRQLMELIVKKAPRFPADQRAIEYAEEEFSTDQLEFLKTEFGGLCKGLDICLQSFTGRTLEIRATDLYTHLKGLIGNGQVKLLDGASDGTDAIALAKFLFRIGFLEVRYPQEHDVRYEVRDVMRHPEHWKSVRNDDAVKWAVRSAFYYALRSHR